MKNTVRFLLALSVALTLGILHLLDIMQDRAFSVGDMARAYGAGCSIGFNEPLDQEKMERCLSLSLQYNATLAEIMDQDVAIAKAYERKIPVVELF